MKPSKWLLILTLMLTSGLSSGCLNREIYLKPRQSVEIAEPVRIKAWVKNADTGKREKRILKAQAGYVVGRP